jgi:hypothetical protein
VNRKDQVFPLEGNKLYKAFGLNKRELYAAFALIGFATEEDASPEEVAENAVRAADAIIALLDNEGVNGDDHVCEYTGLELR